MCLTITPDSKRQTATEDIVCYKLVIKLDNDTGYFRTPYRLKPIELGETYGSIIDKNNNVIEQALHSFKSIEQVYKLYPRRKKNYYNMYLVKCLIPKGSKYHEGIFIGDKFALESFASNKITYTDEIIHEWLPIKQ